MQQAPSNAQRAMALLTSLFFMWGFITVMNDVLINTFEGIFELSALQSGLVQSAFFGAFFFVSLAYFLISINKGVDPINRIGYKNGMVYSLAVCGLGCLVFYPAAVYNSYGIFLLALFILAAGVTFLQICANPYAAILGNPETAPSRLNFAQGFNSLGTTIGPLLGTLFIFYWFAETAGEASVGSVAKTYVIYGVGFLFLALFVKFSNLPPFINKEKMERGFGVLNFKHLRLGIFAIFFYVGGEVAIGSYLPQLFQDEGVMNMPQVEANFYLAYYWGSAMIGRLMGAISLGGMKNKTKKMLWMAVTAIACVLFIFIAKDLSSYLKEGEGAMVDFSQLSKLGLFFAFMVVNYLLFLLGQFKAARTLMVFSLAVVLLLLLVAFGTGELVFWSAIAIGLFNSIMWSNVFTLAIRDLGKYTAQGSSLLVMAIVGGAIFPPLTGYLADLPQIGIQLAYLLPMICYVYLAFYGLQGYKTKHIAH